MTKIPDLSEKIRSSISSKFTKADMIEAQALTMV